METRVRATTIDNPYNPFVDWDEWYFYDLSHGYNTCDRLGRLAQTSEGLTDAENEQLVEEAIDELVKYPAFDKEGNLVEYKKVYETD